MRPTSSTRRSESLRRAGRMEETAQHLSYTDISATGQDGMHRFLRSFLFLVKKRVDVFYNLAKFS